MGFLLMVYKLTVISVVYNDASALKKTISSIKTLKKNDRFKFEFLVVDGGSKDGTVDIIKEYYRLNIVSNYISESDNGIYDAMNKGVEISQGEWLYFLNAGDTFDSDTVLLNLIEQHGKISHDTNLIYGRYRTNGTIQQQVCSLSFLRSHMLNHQSIIYHRSLFEHGGYDLRYRFCADYAHLLSVWDQIHPLALDLCIADFDTTGVSSQVSNKARMWQERLHAVWHSDLNFLQKLTLSSRGVVAFPYHYIKNWKFRLAK